MRFIGGGLIGGSLAEALKTALPELPMALADPCAETRAAAVASGLYADGVFTSPEELPFCEGACYVVAAPLSAYPRIFATLAESLGEEAAAGRCFLTDAGSVKGYAREQARMMAPRLLGVYVGGHPIAGKEGAGFALRDGTLFHGRKALLCPGKGTLPSALAAVSALWKAAGGVPETITEERHDAIYAAVSHLPQLLMFALRLLLREQELDTLFAMKRRPYARLFGSPPALWYDIFSKNAVALRDAFERYCRTLLSASSFCDEGGRPFSGAVALCAEDCAGLVSSAAARSSDEYPCFLFEYLLTGALAVVGAECRHYAGPAFADLMRAAGKGAGPDAPLRDELPCAASLPRLPDLAEGLLTAVERGDERAFLASLV